ncbi:DNA polymerase Y family protein [Streptomyces fradiae]|uniref:DNA polymerase Y family protein n=1 Tax=Streptomyces fradiae TaxID=1906 RepID=UPI0033C82239
MSSVIMHVRCRPDIEPETYRQVLALLEDVSPVVQPIPPAAAVVQVGGALRVHRADPGALAQRTRVRALLQGVDIRIGVASTWATAATASARTGSSGVLWLPDERAEHAFLAGLDVSALYGVGAATAETFRRYGLHTVGAVAAQPEDVVCRLVGKQGRVLRDRTRGADRRAVTPHRLPQAATVSHDFERDMLDPVLLRAALLDLVVTLAERLRARRQIARALTLNVRFAGGTGVEKTRRLAAASAHTDDLRTALWQIWDAMAYQRARIRRLILTAEDLAPAETGPGTQLSLDPAREARHRVEPLLDAINRRYGRTLVRPAGAYREAG